MRVSHHHYPNAPSPGRFIRSKTRIAFMGRQSKGEFCDKNSIIVILLALDLKTIH